jgi:hypothetical protein
MSRKLLAVVLVLGLLTPASRARAGGEATAPPDTVVLKDGSKLRGTVIEEDPKRGVTVLLLDGTTRKVAKPVLDHIDYAPPAAPVVAPVAPAAPVAPPPVVYANTEAPAPAPAAHRSSGALVAGAILMSVGAIVVVGGSIYYVNSAQTRTASYNQQCYPGEGCSYDYETYHDSTGVSIATGLIVVGAVVLVAGAITTLVGARRRAPAPVASLPPGMPRLVLGDAASSLCLVPSGDGLTLHF